MNLCLCFSSASVSVWTPSIRPLGLVFCSLKAEATNSTSLCCRDKSPIKNDLSILTGSIELCVYFDSKPAATPAAADSIFQIKQDLLCAANTNHHPIELLLFPSFQKNTNGWKQRFIYLCSSLFPTLFSFYWSKDLNWIHCSSRWKDENYLLNKWSKGCGS